MCWALVERIFIFGAGCFAPCSRYALLPLLTCLSYEGWSGGLEIAATYSIPCECVQIYIGCTRSSVKVGLKEHQCYICLAQPVKSAVAECSVNRVHCIGLQDTKVLSTKVWIKAWIIIEVINLELRLKNMNRKGCQVLSSSWTLHIVWLKEQQGKPFQRDAQQALRHSYFYRWRFFLSLFAFLHVMLSFLRSALGQNSQPTISPHTGWLSLAVDEGFPKCQ